MIKASLSILTIVFSLTGHFVHANPSTVSVPAETVADQFGDLARTSVAPFLYEGPTETPYFFKKVVGTGENSRVFASFVQSAPKSVNLYRKFNNLGTYYGERERVGTLTFMDRGSAKMALFTSNITAGFEGRTENVQVSVASGLLTEIKIAYEPVGASSPFEGWYLPNFAASEPVAIASLSTAAEFLRGIPADQGDSGPIFGAVQQGLYDVDAAGNFVMNVVLTNFPVPANCRHGWGVIPSASLKVTLSDQPFQIKSVIVNGSNGNSFATNCFYPLPSPPRSITISNAAGNSYKFAP